MKKQQRNRLIVAAVLTVLCALLALVPFTGLEAQGKGVLIVFVWAILMWIVRPIPEYLIGVLAAAILAIFFGMKTNVVSGFSSSSASSLGERNTVSAVADTASSLPLRS